MATSAELEGFYRFLGNEAVSVEALLEPHYVATLRRLESVSEALVLHDTTTFSWSGEPGWLVLGRGYDKLIDYTVGYRTAPAAMQSQPAPRDQAPGSDAFRPLHGADFVHQR